MRWFMSFVLAAALLCGFSSVSHAVVGSASLIVTPGSKPDEIRVEVQFHGVDKAVSLGYEIGFDASQVQYVSSREGGAYMFPGCLYVKEMKPEYGFNRIQAIGLDTKFFNGYQQSPGFTGQAGGGVFVFKRVGNNPWFKINSIAVFTHKGVVQDLSVVSNTTGDGTVSLDQNYPNPFNPETQISFRIQSDTNVRLTIYNVLGQEVRVLADGAKPAGIYSVTWNGRDAAGRQVASGTYFYRLMAGDKVVATKQMILLK